MWNWCNNHIIFIQIIWNTYGIMTLYAESFQYTYVSALADGSFLYKASFKESHACLISLKVFRGVFWDSSMLQARERARRVVSCWSKNIFISGFSMSSLIISMHVHTSKNFQHNWIGWTSFASAVNFLHPPPPPFFFLSLLSCGGALRSSLEHFSMEFLLSQWHHQHCFLVISLRVHGFLRMLRRVIQSYV